MSIRFTTKGKYGKPGRMEINRGGKVFSHTGGNGNRVLAVHEFICSEADGEGSDIMPTYTDEYSRESFIPW